MQIYVVNSGDTVDKIASNYGVSVDKIVYDNQIVYPYELAIGQALLIDDEGAYPENRRAAKSNGFAYPFISRWVLNETLPYLSELSVFSYGFTSDGTLIPPSLEDMWMIESAKNVNVKPILTLTPLGADGKFSNTLINSIVNNLEAQNQLLDQMIATMQSKGFGGANIDFEYILATDRDAFTEFVRNVTTRLNEYGYEVSVDLAPKTSDNQVGLLYEGKDYKSIGEIANNVLVMTYEWGYTYGPPMAVAPINLVRNVIEYAVTVIAPEKINLGIPNYGYDWPLPFVRGTTKARTIGNVEAIRIAIEKGVAISFDEVSMSPFYKYTEDGVEHEVWFEDVRSMQAKFNLIKEFGLRGAGYWQIMQLFRANWLLLQYEFEISRD